MRPSTDPRTLPETQEKLKSLVDFANLFCYFFILNYLRFALR